MKVPDSLARIYVIPKYIIFQNTPFPEYVEGQYIEKECIRFNSLWFGSSIMGQTGPS